MKHIDIYFTDCKYGRGIKVGPIYEDTDSIKVDVVEAQIGKYTRIQELKEFIRSRHTSFATKRTLIKYLEDFEKEFEILENKNRIDKKYHFYNVYFGFETKDGETKTYNSGYYTTKARSPEHAICITLRDCQYNIQYKDIVGVRKLDYLDHVEDIE